MQAKSITWQIFNKIQDLRKYRSNIFSKSFRIFFVIYSKISSQFSYSRFSPFTKCHLYTSCFSRFANIFSHSCQFDDKCIASSTMELLVYWWLYLSVVRGGVHDDRFMWKMKLSATHWIKVFFSVLSHKGTCAILEYVRYWNVHSYSQSCAT